MQLFNAQTLQAEDLDEREAERAVLSGRYGLAKDAKVVVRGEDGSAWEVTGAEAPEALAKGFRFETPEQATERAKQQEFGDSPLAAFGAGAARGVTAGASDYFATQSARQPARFINPFTGKEVQVGDPADVEKQWAGADQRKEALTQLKERNPEASAVGEVAGMVAGAMLPGAAPAKAAAAAGRLTEQAVLRAAGEAAAQGIAKRVVQKAITRAAGSAVEAAYLSTGQLVSEDVLGDSELTAERVISHVGMSALLGGAVGGVLSAGTGSAAALAKKVSKSVSDRVGSRSLQDMATEFADESALKATGARGADIRKLGTEAKVRQLGEDLRTIKLKDGRPVLEAGQTTDDFLDRIRQAEQEVGKDLGDFRQRVDEYVRANPTEAWDFGEYLAQVRKDVLEPLMQSGVPDIRARGKAVYKALTPTQKAWEQGYKLPPSELEKLRSDMAKIVFPRAVKGQGVPPPPPAHAAELYQAERILADWLEKKTEGVVAKMAPDEAGLYARLKRTYESMKKSDQLASKASMQDLGNRWLSPSDYLSGLGGGMLAGGPMGVVAGVATAAAHKVVRERGRSVVAVLAGKVANLSALERASAIIATKTAKAVESFARSVQVAGEQGAAVYLGATAGRSKKAYAEKEEGKDPLDSYRSRFADIHHLAQNPSVLSERLAKSFEGVGEVAPKVTSQIAQRATQAVKFLDSKAPRNPVPATPLTIGQTYQPSDAEIAKWNRYVSAVNDPMTIVAELERGTVSQESVEVMRTLYPKMYQDITTALATKLAGKDVPYHQRVALSLLFGTAMDPTMRPSSVADYQATWAGQSKDPATAAAQASRGTSLLKTKIGQSLQTPVDRLMAGG